MASHADLRDAAAGSDWFVSATIPMPSNLEDAQGRFELEWRNVRRELSDDWDDTEIDEIGQRVGAVDHGAGEALVVIHARGGSTLIEVLEEPVPATSVHEGPLPRLDAVLAARQRAVPHVVVEADRTGADLVAVDGGDVLATDTVEGSTLHIHRGHPGGWSQRRFQQRAENTWEHNARQVADAVADMARRVDARLIAVAGDVRAQAFILDGLPADVVDLAVKIDAGSPEGIAAEVAESVAAIVAERVADAGEQVRAGLADGTASLDADAILDALAEGRVGTLLVEAATDGDGRLPATGSADPALVDRADTVDRAIVAALATDAEILVASHLTMSGAPLAASMRW
jgi:hypothetical protein